MAIITIPDGYKGMLKGIVKALNLLSYCTYIHLVGHWLINMTLCYFLAFYLQMQLKGLWIAKVFLELFIFSAYNILIYNSNWSKIAS